MRPSSDILSTHCNRLRALLARLEVARDEVRRAALVGELRDQVAVMRELRRLRRTGSAPASEPAAPAVG